MGDFPSLKSPAIIAMKGLPITNKTTIADIIAQWSGTPVLFIEDFLTVEATPQSKEEAQRLLRRAFSVLCNVAETQANRGKVNCVVIKSRLCSTFEFDRLIELMIKSEFHALLIIECQLKNELTWQSTLDDYVKCMSRCPHISWYNPISWKDVEMASDDYNAQAWDRHFERSIAQLSNNKQHLVRRLMIDISSSISSMFEGSVSTRTSTPFRDVIKYLLTQEAMDQLPNTVEFDEVRRSILERELNAQREMSQYLCRDERGCVFKYREALERDSCCGACEKPVSGPVYACYYCILVLHESCAEEPKMKDISNPIPYLDGVDEDGCMFGNKFYRFDEEHACDFCKESDKFFSYDCKSCLFQTHLKCRVMPTIIKHACHPEHFLSVWIKPSNPIVRDSAHIVCKGCRLLCFYNGYACVTCNYSCHIRCIAAPREVKHEHGGYEHVMKLWYSYDGMGEEGEDFWCDVCNHDIYPSEWFYRCKDCPYYVSHMDFPSRMPCKRRV